MKIGIMQPYLFPYIGYFQLINAVDKFIILDDVNYINKGWINRNYILVNGVRNLFTIPLREVSQNKLISDVYIAEDDKWRLKFLKTLELSYKKAPYFNETFSLIEEIINSGIKKISVFNYYALLKIINYLGIETKIGSSWGYQNENLKAQNRIIDICLKENASVYINPVGGVDIYSKDDFKKHDIEFHFLKSDNIKYNQFKNEFVPNLSIIDMIMFNTPEENKAFMNQYELI